ncbi:MAG TPA: hypothetical protein VGD88_06505 [Opitutaceae bacterium]
MKRLIRSLGVLFALLAANLASAASFEGTWTTQTQTEGGPLIYTFIFAVGADKAVTLRVNYSLAVVGMGGDAVVSDLKIEGDTVSFKETTDFSGYAVVASEYKGVLSGSEIKFEKTSNPGGTTNVVATKRN